MERREFLMTAVLSTAGGAALFGCKRTSESSGTASVVPSSWNPSPLLFLAGETATFDLGTTLPAGVARGGTFSLAPGSGPLPAQVALSPNGVLTADSPVDGTAANIIFLYTEPG